MQKKTAGKKNVILKKKCMSSIILSVILANVLMIRIFHFTFGFFSPVGKYSYIFLTVVRLMKAYCKQCYDDQIKHNLKYKDFVYYLPVYTA